MASALFSPIRLADLALDNRIVVSPMCQYSADDGVANDWHVSHLGMLANSGAGLVDRRGDARGAARPHHPRLPRPLLRRMRGGAAARRSTTASRIGTAKIGIQLAHAGRKASAQRPWEGGAALTPRPGTVADDRAVRHPVRRRAGTRRAPMAEDDIARVREAFVAAAKRAVRIGFDAIELHMAHGYLLHSFISPISNKRTDQYGGSLENRMRLPLEVARAVRAVVPKGMPLGARITGTDWLDGGLTGGRCGRLREALKEAGCDYVDVSSGGVTAEARTPADAGLQRADRRAGQARGRHRHPRGRHDRDSEAGRGDHRRRQGRHGGARPAPCSTIRTGAGTPPVRSAPRSRGRSSTLAPRRSCGRGRRCTADAKLTPPSPAHRRSPARGAGCGRRNRRRG